LFEYQFEVGSDAIGFLAEIEIVGDTLHLKDIAIYPKGIIARISVGVGPLFKWLRILEEMARSAGFRSMRITARRLSGANPGADVHIERRLY